MQPESVPREFEARNLTKSPHQIRTFSCGAKAFVPMDQRATELDHGVSETTPPSIVPSLRFGIHLAKQVNLAKPGHEWNGVVSNASVGIL